MPARSPSLQWYDEWNQNDFSCDETWRNDVTVCWKSANLPKLISYRSGTSMTLPQYSIPNVHTCGEFQSRPCGECVLAVWIQTSQLFLSSPNIIWNREQPFVPYDMTKNCNSLLKICYMSLFYKKITFHHLWPFLNTSSLIYTNFCQV